MYCCGGRGLGVDAGDAQIGLGRFDQDGFIVDVVLEALGGGGLCIAVVHHLVKELIDQDEILTDRFLAQDATIILKNFRGAVKELNGGRGGDIEPCGGTKEKAILTDKEEIDAV